jgi:hypothetical protein
MTVTTVYPVRSVNWEAMVFAASICSCELALPEREGGRVRITGFSARPSSTVGKGGGAASVGVTAGDVTVCVTVAVGCAKLIPGKLQFASSNVIDNRSTERKRL